MFWIRAPTPTPNTAIEIATCQYGVWWSTVLSPARPATRKIAPNTISGFHRPVRVTI